MATPTRPVFKALGDTLAAGPSTSSYPIYVGRGPDTAKPPYIVMAKMDTQVERTFTDRTFRGLYLVKAVVQSRSRSLADQMDSDIDTLLENATLTIPGFNHILCMRDHDMPDRDEVLDGDTWWSIGGVWAIWEQQAI